MTTTDELRARLDTLTVRDAHRLGTRLSRHGPLRDLEPQLIAAEQRLAARQASMPRIGYPEQLPISARRSDIAAAIASSQVVVVAGETGSGKTTQLPKICLELGRGVRGMIGHTQPRRLAARSVAERIAEELGTPLGEAVGYTVRFHDQVSAQTLVKLMTDGVLLAEVQRDRDLLAYDTIIVDEAHERSLNIDFLLGYLAQLLPRRPDLKLVITSATIDPQRFADHFAPVLGGVAAPVVEVSGRSYPVELRYRPPEPETDPVQAVVDAVDELAGEGPGDVLVFLSGEREIRDTAEALRAASSPATEVLPLFARLSAAEQHRVFTRPQAGRRIVLATNVAETSLTVPGIRYVVDPGTARISRYSQRTKVQRLPIEAISQASATQRAGRCGRVADGICIRLYEEDDLLARPAFTDPEILRTNLASVLLQMSALGLGDVASFPFVDPPDRRQVQDGLDLLHELGAIEPQRDGRLTTIGRRLAQLPVDPRLGRMVLEADTNGCVRDVLVIVAALSIQDPRERPQDAQQQAAQLHARFADETSDFLAYLNLWRYLQEQQKQLSSSAFRRLCRREHLSYLRIREWQDLHGQLRRVVRRLDLSLDASPTSADGVHRSLLAGLLSHIGLREAEARDYLGARSARFALGRESSLAKKAPRWLFVGELVETGRTYGRVAARLDPAWAERLGAHLVKRQYSEPHWVKKRAGVVAVERVTLYGVPLVVGRTVDFGRIAPVLSRELFLRHALIEGDWDSPHAFVAANRALLGDVEELESRARRRDLVVEDRVLYDFYDARIPPDVVSGGHFDAWWKKARRSDPDLLTFTMADLVSDAADVAGALEQPDVWLDGDLRLPLSYVFEPGAPDDGVSVHVPVALLNRLEAEQFSWQVPGLRHELITALLRSLPKPLRLRIVPAPDTASALLAVLEPRHRPLLDALELELINTRRVDVRRQDWDWAKVPEHLQMRFVVEDDGGRELAAGRDLDALSAQLAPAVQQSLSAATNGLERTGLTGWDLDELPRSVQSGAVRGYPALVEEAGGVAVRVLGSPAEQQAAMWAGTRRLLMTTLPSPVKALVGRLPNRVKLVLARAPGGPPATLSDCALAAVDALLAAHGGPAWDRAGFERLREQVRAELPATFEAAVLRASEVVTAWLATGERLAALPAAAPAASVADARAQHAALAFSGFVTATGTTRLPDLLRYTHALDVRLERLRRDPARDRLGTVEITRVAAEVAQARARARPRDPAAQRELDELPFRLQELRISLFAPTMRTRYPVSEKRILKIVDTLLLP